MERTLDYKGRWRNHTVAFRVWDDKGGRKWKEHLITKGGGAIIQ